jgi:hypothetical protein
MATPERDSPTFESCLPVIEDLLNRRRYKWQMRAIVWMDFEDIKQIIKIHLFKKWSLYDPAKPLQPWINSIINHQMINLGRNYYYSHARPCLRCPSNEGNDLCAITLSGKQCEECHIYKRWTKTKKAAYDIQLALPISNHEQEVHELASTDIDFDKSIKLFHLEMRKVLNNSEWRAYHCLYILHLSEEETGRELGFKSSEGRKPGYARIKQLQKVILKKANKLKHTIDLL